MVEPLAEELETVDLAATLGVIRNYAHPTPLFEIPELGIWVKDERALPTSSFKFRGAANWLAQLEYGRPIVTASSGNHARALMYLLNANNCPSNLTVVVTPSADPAKVYRLRAGGCTVVVCEGGNSSRDQLAMKLATETGAAYCSSHDDIHVIAGQATVALEILDSMPQVQSIFVPVGGGGLYAGTLLAAHRNSMLPTVVGVEPSGANAMTASLLAQRRVSLASVDTMCDALRAMTPGALCFRIATMYGGRTIAVSDKQILEAQRLLAQYLGTVEMSAAAAVAGALLGCARRTVCVVTGGVPAM